MPAKELKGKIVAQLAVQVYPELDGFRRRLRRGLEAIEDSTDPVEVGVDLDGEGAAREAALVRERLEDQLRHIEAGVDVDDSELSRLRRKMERLHEDAGKGFTLLPGESDADFERRMERMRQAWKEAHSGFFGSDGGLGDELKKNKKLAAQLDRLWAEHSKKARVAFDVVPAKGWDKRVKGLLDKVFLKEYRGQVHWEMDLSESNKDLHRRLEREFDKQGNWRYVVDVDAEVSSGHLEKALEALRRAAAAKLAETGEKIELEVKPDMDAGELSRLSSRFSRLVREGREKGFTVDIQARLDENDVNGALRRLREHMRSKALGEAGLQIDVNANLSHHDLRSMERKLRKFKRDWDGKELEFQLSLDHTSRYRAAARLHWLARDRFVKLKPVVDSKAFLIAKETLDAMSGFRLSRDITRRTWDLVKNLDKAVPAIGVVSSGLAVAASAAGVLSMHTLTVAGGMVKAANAMLLLAPGMAVAGSMVAASFIVPLKKIKEHITWIEGDFKDLGNAMASRFWGQAKAPFTEAYGEIFPRFREGLKLTSEAAGRHFGRVFKSMSMIVAPRMQEMFAATAHGVDVLGTHSDSLAHVLDVLGRHGAKAFESFTDYLGRATDGWAKWLQEADKSGRLEQILSDGVRELRNFGRAGREAGRVLFGLYDVARRVGGADLGRFADGLHRAAEAVRSQGFVKGFTDSLGGAKAAWEAFKSTVGSSWGRFWLSLSATWGQAAQNMGLASGRLFKGLLDTLSGANIQRGLERFFSGFAEGMKRLESLWPRLERGLGSLLTFMGSLGKAFAPVIASTLGVLSDAATRLEPVLSRMAEAAGGKLARGIELVGRVTIPVANALAHLLELASKVPLLVEALTAGFLAFKTWGAVAPVVSVLDSGLAALFGRGAANVKHFSDTLVATRVGVWFLEASEKATWFGRALSGVRSMLAALAASAGPVSLALGAIAAAAVAGDAALHGVQDGIRALGDRAALSLDRVRDATGAALSDIRAFFQDLGKRSGVEFANNLGAASHAGVSDFRVENVNMLDKVAESYRYYGKSISSSWSAYFESMFSGSRFAAQANAGGEAVAKFGERIAQLAKVSSGEGVNALRQLGRAAEEGGVSHEAWRGVVQKYLEDFPEIRAALVEHASKLGLATDEQSLLTLATERGDAAFQQEAKSVADASKNLSVLDSVLGGVNEGQRVLASQTEAGIGSVRNMVKSWDAFGNAASAAAAEADTSLSGFMAHLREQQEAMRRRAENMVTLLQSGVTQPVLDSLAKLPNGAKYMDELVSLLHDKSEESQRKFHSYLADLSSAAAATGGDLAAIGSKAVSDYELAYVGRFRAMRDALVAAAQEHGLAVGEITAATTVDELSKALSAQGVVVEQSGQGLVAVFRDGAVAALPDAMGVAAVVAGQQFSSGVLQQGSMLLSSGSSLGKSASDGVLALVDEYRATGNVLGAQVAAGVAAMEAQTRGSGTVVGAGALAGAKAFDEAMFGGGRSLGSQAASGMLSTRDAARDAGGSVAGAAGSGAAGVSLHGTGHVLGSSLIAGFDSKYGHMQQSGRWVAEGGAGGAGSVNFWNVGWNMISGMVSGLWDGFSRVTNAAWDVARSAYNAAKRALGIHSPSRAFRELGAFSAEGMALGLRSGADGVVAEAEVLTDRVLSASRRAAGVNVNPVKVDVSSTRRVVADLDPAGLRGLRVALRVGEREFDSYVSDVADSRVLEGMSLAFAG